MICEGTMETYRLYYPNDFDLQLEPVALAIGFFDGLHLGHKEVIEKMIEIADEKNLKKAVMTFDPHPSVVLLSLIHISEPTRLL